MPREWPGVSVVVAAYREQSVIAEKVSNTLENGYPGSIEVLVVVDDPETAAAARTTAARVIEGTERKGKASALNTGIRESTFPVIVLTDANAMLDPGSLERLVRWLDAPGTGAVAGEKRLAAGESQGMYWEFESWLKRREVRFGTTISVTGELIALRRAEYRAIPPDVSVDDLWIALDVVEDGGRIAYEPLARAHESAAISPRDEWERRTRIIAGALDVAWRRRRLLAPGTGGVAPQLWGHLLVRSSPGPISQLLLLARALSASRRSRVARLFVAVHALAAFSLALDARGKRLPAPARLGAQVLFLQSAGVGGTIRWARRRANPELWPKPERVVAARSESGDDD
jgi:cellulose synthase/poly-beta-1,6-N-acetylglucosamine synthase-like glycosyltransferase